MPVIRAPRATPVSDADEAIYAQPPARTMGPCTYPHLLAPEEVVLHPARCGQGPISLPVRPA